MFLKGLPLVALAFTIKYPFVQDSVSDPFHFDADPVQDTRIRIRVRFWIRIQPKIEQIPIFFCIRLKTLNDVFSSLLFAYIKQKK